MKKMAERMQQNNVQTTITNETVTENVQEIKNNYNIQLEAMTEKLNGVLTRSKRTNLELTESQKQLGMERAIRVYFYSFLSSFKPVFIGYRHVISSYI